MTTFVLPSEVFPVSMRTTGHGIAAGIGKLGAFVGRLPGSPAAEALRTAGHAGGGGVAAIAGFALTSVLPEPARRSLEDLSSDAEHRTELSRSSAEISGPAPSRTVDPFPVAEVVSEPT